MKSINFTEGYKNLVKYHFLKFEFQKENDKGIQCINLLKSILFPHFLYKYLHNWRVSNIYPSGVVYVRIANNISSALLSQFWKKWLMYFFTLDIKLNKICTIILP